MRLFRHVAYISRRLSLRAFTYPAACGTVPFKSLAEDKVPCAKSPNPCRALPASANHSCNHEGCGNAAIGLFLAHVSTAWPPPSICLNTNSQWHPLHEASPAIFRSFHLFHFFKKWENFLSRLGGGPFLIQCYTGGHKLLTPRRSSARRCQ